MTVAGPWTLQFDAAFGGPKNPVALTELLDWTEFPDDGIRYYSGTAVYRTSFVLDSETASSARELDLGILADMAEVVVNGQNLGIVWTPPYRVSVGKSVRAGINELEVRVTNRWFNRYILDESLPETNRVTHSSLRTDSNGRVVTQPNDNPYKSGLLGPVRLMKEVSR